MANAAHKNAIHQVLSANLKFLMKHHPDGINSTPKIAEKSKGLVSQRTAARAVAGRADDKPVVTTTESLAGFATAFGVAPWELLHPDFPSMYSQRRLSLAEQEKVEQLREEISALSKPAQMEIWGKQPLVEEIMQPDPYPNEKLEAGGWSAAGKAVSRRRE